ncbi:ABC transporter permease [Pullulanibacillus sp. KACC 23026]|uniref:ABC transporter permease n=1 Tax=Pullulanibacillus sp. KACC 23026 TaxID=3028315 RepID=UPI0023AF430F|nr:ABC transporter permease [Pullulanibacillus sp. KACC 23026]WEG14737.1 ABC transporter permease [Pullulanibacillus sp. KACC 23026]
MSDFFHRFLFPFWENKKSRIGVLILLIFVLLAIFSPIIAPYSPQKDDFDSMLDPSWKHLFGTTQTGEDIFSQWVYGTRISLLVAFLAGLSTTLVGLIIGLLAGYLPGVVDEILSYAMNVFLVLPALPLMIVLAAYFPVKGIGIIVLVIVFTSWAWGARAFRAQAKTLRTRDYITAARFSGDSLFRILFREILPNMMSLVAAGAIGSATSAILAESSLEFLGLGDPTVTSWGTMLYWAQTGGALLQGKWVWMFVPGATIAIFGSALVLMNFAVDRLSNPRLNKSTKKSKKHERVINTSDIKETV